MIGAGMLGRQIERLKYLPLLSEDYVGFKNARKKGLNAYHGCLKIEAGMLGRQKERLKYLPRLSEDYVGCKNARKKGSNDYLGFLKTKLGCKDAIEKS